MARFLFIITFFCSTWTLSCCQREGIKADPDTSFDSVPSAVIVQPTILEASGIADSKRNPGYLWVQEDGGNPSEIIALKHNGTVQQRIVLNNITNRDWEDIVVSGNDIYLGEIGDNNEIQQEYAIYKFPEPAISTDTVRNVEAIRFRYPDGSHDAEAFLVDPANGAIYIITKRDSPSRIYKLTPPFSSSTIHQAEDVGRLSYNGVVSAALSPDRRGIIMKTYFELGYYKLNNAEKIETALSRQPILIPYQGEPQGEAVCFSATNNGYFTLSEKGTAPDVKLYFYKRK